MRLRHALLIVPILLWGLSSALMVSAQETRYTVRAGDTLATIARSYRVTPALLAQRNAITYAGGLRAGQTLIIPAANFVATSHTVKPGESLAVIAQLYETTIAELQGLNGLGGPRIVPGQVLQLPGAASLGQGGGAQSVIVVTATPSPVPSGQVGGFVPVTPSTPSAPLVHIVEVGETLQRIAARYGTTLQALAQANNLQNPNFLPAGARLIIPDTNLGTGGGAVGGPTTGANTVSAFYIVRPGDTLSQIAERFGTTVQAIQRANGLTNTVIFPDSTLLIPFNLGVGGPVVTVPTPTPLPLFPFANGTIRGNRYTVAQGDTLFGIANRFNVDAWSIARANRILNLNHIFSDQILVIPGR
ncbi:MAG: LysM peptidoglycan-binding domain-containing protein [Anaerolineae bacterium]|nr:LysM peptidoglycan-binding domain-containing protein [Anaerolineae bacterium]MDW8171668.1 LysM peptidoglycan-binding domain-containing protein [Anaerolineae bacterium]